MQELRATMQANQALLENLVEDRPHTDREPFIRFVCDTLRTAPQEQYSVMKDLIFDIVRQGGQGARQRDSSQRDSQEASTSWARPAQSLSTPPAPPACSASQLPSQPFSQSYSQQYYQPQYQQNWQYGGFQQQAQQQQPQQQQLQEQQQQTPTGRPRESTESFGRLLGQDMQAEEWNMNLSLDSSVMPPGGRLSQASQATLKTPNVSATSPGQQSRCSTESGSE
jgi:hypothetical protein